MMNMDKKNKIILIVIIVIIALILLIGGIYFVTVLVTRNNIQTTGEDLYNKTLYVSATLPDIFGNENVSKDEFGKKTNISEDVKKDKKWMNLDFTDFNVYSMNSKTSVISFKISNNNNMIIESSKFQFQLKDNSGNIVSIIDFDEVVLPSTGVIDVTVDITGDITNVKDIVIDDINYTMTLQEVK